MREGLRREVFVLVALVLAVDLVFIAAYFLAGLRGASDPVKLGFTVLWTLANLAVVMRGLTRLRKARLQIPSNRA
jgi:hypothetical protein